MPDSSFVITVEAVPHPDDLGAIRAGLEQYNLQFAPPNPFDPLTIFVRDAENSLVGGLLGGTFWGWLQIDILWLSESARSQGLGSQLLEMAEREGVRRGCHYAFVDTMSFQAPEFYKKNGYVLYTVLEDFPRGHSRHYFKKELQPVDFESP